MKNILKDYFVLKIAQFDKISEVDTLSLKKMYPQFMTWHFIESLGQKSDSLAKIYEKKNW